MPRDEALTAALLALVAEERWSASEIAEQLGVSRQRVHQIIRDRGYRVRTEVRSVLRIEGSEMHRYPVIDWNGREIGRASSQAGAVRLLKRAGLTIRQSDVTLRQTGPSAASDEVWSADTRYPAA